MMLSRFVRIQLSIFAVLTVIGLVVMTLQYVRLPALLGVGQYTLTVELPSTGGLYPHSNVTYRVTGPATVPGGSNPGGMITRAQKTDDGYVINGAKMWITNGSTAQVAIIWAASRFTSLSRTALFWAAFILTRPLGAVVGDLLDKPLAAGGLALSRYGASLTLALITIACLVVLPQRPAMKTVAAN